MIPSMTRFTALRSSVCHLARMRFTPSRHVSVSRAVADPDAVTEKKQKRPLRRLTKTAPLDDSPADVNPQAAAKNAALDDVVARINKKHGSGTISSLRDQHVDSDIQRIPTGCLTLDYALGGGIPRGRIIEIFGPESCGKTTLALCIMAEAQRLGDNVALIDAEYAYDKTYGRRMGVRDDKMFYVQPDHGDAALDVVDDLCRSGAIGIIAVDSVAALVPRAELEKDIGEPTMGTAARMMSQGLKRIAASASKFNCTVIFINQLRMKIGVVYGNPEVTTGGNALKYFASQRIEVRKSKIIDGAKDGPARGLKIRAKVTKNKVGPPQAICLFDIIYDRGIDRVGCLLDAAVQVDVIERRGSHHYFTSGTGGEVKLGNGRDNAVAFLEQAENEALIAEIDAATRAAWTGETLASVSLDDDDDMPAMDELLGEAEAGIP